MHINYGPESPLSRSEAELSAGGLYEPGFFHLRIDIHDLDLNELAKAPAPIWASTFLHEYVHFLQDITSTHGLSNFIKVIQHLKDANKHVLNDPRADFAIPLRLTNEYNYITNKQLGASHYGDSERAISIRYISYKEEIEEIRTTKLEVIKTQKYQITYYDQGAHSTSTCHFGSRHIKEYMAHAVQSQFAPGTLHDDIPYRLVELMLNKEAPQLANDTSLFIALCDASLMDDNPARLFFRTLERMKAYPGWTPTCIDSIYEFALKDVIFQNGNQMETPESLFKARAQQSIDEFRDALKAEVFRDNVVWFEELIRVGQNLRLKERGFITQLVYSAGIFSRKFEAIIKTLGVPFTTDADNKGHFSPPKALQTLQIRPYFPKVFQAIRKTYSGQRQCSLHPFCDSEAKNRVTNGDCLEKPWERVNLPQLCPYAQIWKTWGLLNRKPLSAVSPTS